MSLNRLAPYGDIDPASELLVACDQGLDGRWMNDVDLVRLLERQGYVAPIVEPNEVLKRSQVVSLRITEAGRRRCKMAVYLESARLFGHTLEFPAAIERSLSGFVDYLDGLTGDIAKALGHDFDIPLRIGRLRDTAIRLGRELSERRILHSHDKLEYETMAELLVLACRQQRARLSLRLDRLQVGTRSAELAVTARREYNQLLEVLGWQELSEYLHYGLPRVTDFVNVGLAYKKLGWSRSPGEVVPDEKFGILNEPKSFARDFHWAADQASARGRSFAVGYIDIDKFKELNKRRTETWVDRHVLPVLMRTIESYCFARAFAYREGGDEYIVLVPNSKGGEAQLFFDGLRECLAALTFDAEETITVSIGYTTVGPNSTSTTYEVKKRANEAKERAKETGRNRVVRFVEEDEVKIIAFIFEFVLSCTGPNGTGCKVFGRDPKVE